MLQGDLLMQRNSMNDYGNNAHVLMINFLFSSALQRKNPQDSENKKYGKCEENLIMHW